MEVLETDAVTGEPVGLGGDYERDEARQATYLRELLEIFDSDLPWEPKAAFAAVADFYAG